jgi:hypothetical protein
VNTCGDLITLALKTAGVLGIGQTAQAEDSNDALTVLQMMLAAWARDRFLAWDLVEQVIPSTGATSYPLTTRPVRIDSAFARLTGASAGGGTGAGMLDYPLAVIASREEYNAIGLKSLTTFPAAVFLDTNWPTGALYVWPIPATGQFDIHIAYRRALPGYLGLTDALALPPEYYEAALYGLAIRLAPLYGLDPRPTWGALYRGALTRLRASNAQMRPATIQAPGVSGGSAGSGGISGAVGPAQSIIRLGTPNAVLG